jgi:hypothetical protein
MTKKLLYETYLEKTGDRISFEEWILSESKVKKLGSYWDAMKRYGIVGLASYISGNKSITDSATGGVLSVPLSMVLSAGYKKTSSICASRCKNQLCKQKCYLNSCGIVIKEIHDAMKDVKSKTKDSKKILKKLDKQLVKWVKRYNQHRSKIKELVDEEQKPDNNSVASMAKYYVGNQDDL